MRCWDILQLEPTADIRAIKKAYAVQLKQNKPDENPAGFQQLHAAYQQALDWADRHAEAEPVHPATAEPPPGPAEPVPSPQIQPEYPDAIDDFDEEPLSPEEEAWENHLDQQWDALVEQVEQLLEQPDRRNLPAAWDFLMHFDAFMDIEFKTEFSLRFMQRLLEIHFQQRLDGLMVLLPETVQHLNRIFWWSERRALLEPHFEPDEFDDFMAWWQAPPPATHTPPAAPDPILKTAPPPYANYYARWVAFLLDVLPLALTGYLVNRFAALEPDAPLFTLVFTLLAYALLTPLFEASPLQATPGKYVCRMKVADRDDRRIALWRALWRCLLFLLCLRFLFIAVVINLFIWDGRLVQDRLSGTRVLKRDIGT